MERLADYIEERNALRSKVLTAFIYPAVVPRVVSTSRRRGRSCPSSRRAMLAASEYVRNGAR